MFGPIIAIDVSKDSSHAQLFESFKKPMGKPFVFDHDKQGFDLLSEKLKMLEEFTGEKVSVVLEYTGHYSIPVVRWCLQNDVKVYAISPLLSAKFRKKDLRGTKTDKKDCANIAGVYFSQDNLRVARPTDPLQELSRRYQRTNKRIVGLKCQFMKCLDQVFPMFEKKIGDPYTDKSINVLINYSHPEKILKAGRGNLGKFIAKVTSHTEKVSEKYADELIRFAKDCVSGCSIDSCVTEELSEYGQAIIDLTEKCESIIARIKEIEGERQIESVRKVCNFKSSKLIVLILAEIGDISRFKAKENLVSYAGMDPVVYQSGEQTGKGLSITRKGNSLLRKYTYLAVCCIIREDPSSPITQYFQKKIKEGKPAKVARIACCVKLLRLIHASLTLQDNFKLV